MNVSDKTGTRAPQEQVPFLSELDAVVFDLDGTLIDSRQDLATAVNHALSESSLPTLQVDILASYVGDGASMLLQRATGLAQDDPRFTATFTCFQQYYVKHTAVQTRPYPGVVPTLRTLQQNSSLKLAVCTNKPRAPTLAVLDALELSPFFSCVVAGDDLKTKKPAPEMLLLACKELGATPTRTLMIGDGPQDIGCGHHAGTRTAAVSFGIKSSDLAQAAPAEFTLHNMSDLLSLLGL